MKLNRGKSQSNAILKTTAKCIRWSK